jgi:tetratricopeptide (TPR) repeat protein
MNSHFMAAGQQVRPGIFRLFQLLLAGLLLGLAVVPVAIGQTINTKTMMVKASSGKPIRIKNFDKVSTDSLRILLKNPNLSDSSRYYASSKLCGRLVREGSREALDVTLKNLAHVRKMKHEEFICRALLNTGVYYSQFAEHTEALKYYNEGAILAEARQWHHLAWRLYNGIGNIEGIDMHDPVKGLQWLNRSLRAQLQVPPNELSSQMRVSVRYNLANLYSKIKKYDSTNYYTQQALVIAKADHDIRSMGALAVLKAVSFTYMEPQLPGAMDSAIVYFNKSYGYGMESKDYSLATASCLSLSDAKKALPWNRRRPRRGRWNWRRKRMTETASTRLCSGSPTPTPIKAIISNPSNLGIAPRACAIRY